MKHQFKVGDNVIGVQYPDNVPAKVIELIEGDYEFPLVKIEYEINGIFKNATINEYRLKLAS